jgi:hypothetical protein
MRTEELIRAMAADTRPASPVWVGLACALPVAALAVAAVGLSLLGMRPDLGIALAQAAVVVKQGFPWLLAVGAFGAALRLARPGDGPGRWGLLIALVPLLVAAAVLVQRAVMPSALWYQAFLGQTHRVCVLYISMMAAPLLVVVLLALRRGASTRPALAGAAGGLLAGSVAAGIYALHCTEDSPLFYGFWYVLAILIATAAGALAGRHLLRW